MRLILILLLSGCTLPSPDSGPTHGKRGTGIEPRQTSAPKPKMAAQDQARAKRIGATMKKAGEVLKDGRTLVQRLDEHFAMVNKIWTWRHRSMIENKAEEARLDVLRGAIGEDAYFDGLMDLQEQQRCESCTHSSFMDAEQNNYLCKIRCKLKKRRFGGATPTTCICGGKEFKDIDDCSRLDTRMCIEDYKVPVAQLHHGSRYWSPDTTYADYMPDTRVPEEDP